jgi:hypothetical protein
MNLIFRQLTQQIRTLGNLLSALNDGQYSQKITHLGNASIGQHSRHIIEMLQCAVNGFETGTVDYVNRQRNLILENDCTFAQSYLEELERKINRPDKQLQMQVEEMESFVASTVPTTYYREIVYNTEHAIHHLALIKVALIEMHLDIVNDEFGMAYSTIKFKTSQKSIINSQQIR